MAARQACGQTTVLATAAPHRRLQVALRHLLPLSLSVPVALSAPSGVATAVTVPTIEIIAIPAVQITSLTHQRLISGAQQIVDGVGFPCGSGAGTCSSSGFTAGIVQGDEILMRFEAPSGEQFHVFRDANLSTADQFAVNASWVAASSDTPNVFSTAVINFENLTGTAPTEAPNPAGAGPGNVFGVGNAGGQVVGVWQGNVTGDFTFTALTLSFTVSNAPPGAQAIFGPVDTFPNPSGSLLLSNLNFGAGGIGLSTAPDQIQMQLEPIPEPSTVLLLGSGIAGLLVLGRTRMGRGAGGGLSEGPQYTRRPLHLLAAERERGRGSIRRKSPSEPMRAHRYRSIPRSCIPLAQYAVGSSGSDLAPRPSRYLCVGFSLVTGLGHWLGKPPVRERCNS